MTWTTENGTGPVQRVELKQIFESTGLGALVSTFETEQTPSGPSQITHEGNLLFVLLEKIAPMCLYETNF